MKSIRIYLVIIIVAAITLANFIASLNGYRDGMAAAENRLDAELMELSQTLNALIASAQTPPTDLLPERELFQFWRNGALLYHSVNAPSALADNLATGFHQLNYNGLRWRVMVGEHADGELLVGIRTDLYSRLLEELILQSILPVLVILPLLALLIWLLVGTGLRPLRRLAGELRVRASNDLDPIDSDGYPLELAQVVSSTNQLFHRLGEAFERERRLSADAAHELRTPLTTLKLGLHNLRQEGCSNHDNGNNTHHQTLLDDMEASIDRMNHSVEQILTLNKLSPENLQRNRSRFNLQTVAQEAIATCYPQLSARSQHIDLIAEPVTLTGNAFAMEILFKNLLENASKYTPQGGRLRVTLGALPEEVLIVVEDTGPGIDPALYERVFDRFYRVGGDRHQSNTTGSGLGLALVEQIVRFHLGAISLDKSVLGGLKVTVRLPRSNGDTAP